MAHAAFDTLKYAEQLRLAGIAEQQAKIMSEAQNEILLELVGTQVASKLDIRELKAEFKADIAELRSEFKADIAELRAEVKADIAELRSEFKADIAELRAEVKADIAELRTEFKADIAELRAELKAEISDLRTELTKIKGKLMLLYWMMGFLLTSNMAIIVKLFIH